MKNSYPAKHVCFYCNQPIVNPAGFPTSVLDCKKHMFKCEKHPARELIVALEKISLVTNSLEDPYMRFHTQEIRDIADHALLCEI